METKIEALQLTPTDVEALTPRWIADVIMDIKREKTVFSQFFKTNTDLVKNKGDRIVFPKKRTGIVVQTGLGPGAAISASSMPYTGVTITMDGAKAGIGIAITGEAIRAAQRDVIAEQIKEAGLAWADAEDIMALEAMFPAATTILATAGTVAALGPVVGIKSRTPNIHVVNFHDRTPPSSIVATAANQTITYWYVPSGVERVLTSSLSCRDILLARGRMLNFIEQPDYVLVHGDHLPFILFDPAVKFVEQATQRGEGFPYSVLLGKLWDMNVIVSSRVPRGAVILVNSQAPPGYRVVRKELELKKDEITGMNRDVLFYWGFAEVKYGVVNDKSYAAVIPAGTITEVNVFAVSP